LAAPATEILQDLASVLRGGGLFALVTLGPSGSASEVPRAAVVFEGQDFFQADDDISALWLRLRLRIAVHIRCDDPAESIARAGQLCASVAEAILEDPYRSGRCRDLPIGRATEIGRTEFTPGLRRPEAEVSLAVRCHFQIEQGQ
jgi:hypothetical protein